MHSNVTSSQLKDSINNILMDVNRLIEIPFMYGLETAKPKSNFDEGMNVPSTVLVWVLNMLQCCSLSVGD